MKRLKTLLSLMLTLSLGIVVFAACGIAKYKVTIVAPVHATLTVMQGETTINDGDRVEKDKDLTITWTADIGYTAVLKIDGTAVTPTTLGTYTHKVTAAVKVELATTLQADTTATATEGLVDLSEVENGPFSGAFLGAVGGADLEENKNAVFTFTLDRPAEGSQDMKYLRLIKVKQLSGVTEDNEMQLIAFDADYNDQGLVASGDDTIVASVYYDLLANWGGLGEIVPADGEIGELINELSALGEVYSGYWGNAAGGGKLLAAQDGVGETTQSDVTECRFAAKNAGVYLLTMDIASFETGFPVIESYSILVTVTAA